MDGVPAFCQPRHGLQRGIARLEESRDAAAAGCLAWDRLVAAGGRVRVAQLSAELALPRRRLVQLFQDDFGLSPKRVAQLIRLDRALSLSTDPANSAWTSIAFDCGYYDQSHMINDFRDRLGITPDALRTRS